jgi:hypothetical protein
MAKCRFCENYNGELVKYGIRHHAHHACYLDAGKRIEDLHDWQIVNFPYKLLKERGLNDFATAASERIERQRKRFAESVEAGRV